MTLFTAQNRGFEEPTRAKQLPSLLCLCLALTSYTHWALPAAARSWVSGRSSLWDMSSTLQEPHLPCLLLSPPNRGQCLAHGRCCINTCDWIKCELWLSKRSRQRPSCVVCMFGFGFCLQWRCACFQEMETYFSPNSKIVIFCLSYNLPQDSTHTHTHFLPPSYFSRYLDPRQVCKA